MWYNTKLTEVLDIRYPIIQGPFGGGYSTPKLVSIVSNAGGLGSFGAMHLTPQQIIDTNNSIRELTNKPYAINLWVSDRDEELSSYGEEEFQRLKKIFKPYFDEYQIELPEMPVLSNPRFTDQVEALLDARPPVLSVIFGVPPVDIVEQCKKRNIRIIGTATTSDEAVALEMAGVDVVVASGFEAGGHRGSFLGSVESSLTGSFSLIPQVADRVSIPVVAAGGIADGRGIAAALLLGAQGVQIGTAFLACAESNATDLHKQKLFSDESRYTVLTKVFSGRLARGIRNKFAAEMKQHEADFAPFPMQRAFLAPLTEKIVANSRQEYMGFWAGQSTPLIKHKSANELFDALIKDTGELLSHVNLPV